MNYPLMKKFPRKSKNDSQYYSIKLIIFFTWNKNWIFCFPYLVGGTKCLNKRSVLFLHGNEIKFQFIHWRICTTSKKKNNASRARASWFGRSHFLWARQSPSFAKTSKNHCLKSIKNWYELEILYKAFSVNLFFMLK